MRHTRDMWTVIYHEAFDEEFMKLAVEVQERESAEQVSVFIKNIRWRTD